MRKCMSQDACLETLTRGRQFQYCICTHRHVLSSSFTYYYKPSPIKRRCKRFPCPCLFLSSTHSAKFPTAVSRIAWHYPAPASQARSGWPSCWQKRHDVLHTCSSQPRLGHGESFRRAGPICGVVELATHVCLRPCAQFTIAGEEHVVKGEHECDCRRACNLPQTPYHARTTCMNEGPRQPHLEASTPP